MTSRRLNITFHGVGEPPPGLPDGERNVWLSEERFAATLDAAVGREDVWLSFDDGNRSDVEVALPALTSRGLHATFFIVAGRLQTDGYVSAEEVGQLARAGMTIGSHGMKHRAWRGLAEAELAAEVLDSRRILQEIASAPVQDAACPFGAYDRAVLHALRRAGYRHVYTSDEGAAARTAWLQPRTSVTAANAADALAYAAIRDRPLARAAARRFKLAVKRWR